MFLYPVFALMIGQGVVGLPNARVGMVAFMVITVLLGISVKNYYLNREFHILAFVDPWREVGGFLTENVQKSDPVVFTGRGPVLDYYSGRDRQGTHTLPCILFC